MTSNSTGAPAASASGADSASVTSLAVFALRKSAEQALTAHRTHCKSLAESLARHTAANARIYAAACVNWDNPDAPLAWKLDTALAGLRANDAISAAPVGARTQLALADDNSGIFETVPCPIFDWCTGHEAGESVTAESLHYGEAQETPAGTAYMHLAEGVASIAVTADTTEAVYLDPDEAEAYAAALIEFAKAARSVAA